VAHKEEIEDTKVVIRLRKSKKNRQHNGQKTEEQTTQWSKDRRTDNTMVKRQKNRQHNGQETEEQTTLTIVLSVLLSLDHCVVCSSVS
jgi:hypothetical protein